MKQDYINVKMLHFFTQTWKKMVHFCLFAR